MSEPRPAVDTALRALRARDRTVAELESRLRQRGVGEDEGREALELLARLGYVDDERVARLRVAALAARGCGDEMIRADLEERGVGGATIDAAVAELEPERERAERIVASRGRSPKTARFLASRGFAEEAVEAAVAADAAEGVG